MLHSALVPVLLDQQHRLASPVDKDLLEIPGKPWGVLYVQLLLQVLIHGVGVGPVDINLVEQIEGGLVLPSCKLLDFCVGARLLAAKLVAWEGEDLQA